MLKKIFTLLCLATFVCSLSACGDAGGKAVKPGNIDENTKPLSGDAGQEKAGTEAY